MSQKMSEMLLKGWKMLNEYCPVTGDVPLMQNREGRKFSVALEKFVDELESQADDTTGEADTTTQAPMQQSSPVHAAGAPSPQGPHSSGNSDAMFFLAASTSPP